MAFAEEIPLDQAAGESAAERPGTVGGAVDQSIAETNTFRGLNIGTMSGGKPIKDALGKTIGGRRRWGEGRVVAYGIFPDTYSTDPHPAVNMTRWIRQFISLGDLQFTGRWMGPGPSGEGHLGTGAPIVKVVVREKSEDEKFVFCLNQGGAGEGVVEVPVGSGAWQAEEVLSYSEIAGDKLAEGLWRLPVQLDPWDYRIVRLVKQND